MSLRHIVTISGAAAACYLSALPVFAQSSSTVVGYQGAQSSQGVPLSNGQGTFWYDLGAPYSGGNSPTDIPGIQVGGVVNYGDGHSPESINQVIVDLRYDNTANYAGDGNAEYTFNDNILGNNGSFGPGNVAPTINFGVNLSQTYSAQTFVSQMNGTTICAVFQVDSSGAFVPVPGAVITMYEIDNPTIGKSFTTYPRMLNGVECTYAIFGHLANSSDGPPPDCPYPSGLDSDRYAFSVTAPGFKQSSTSYSVIDNTGSAPQGAAWPGKGMLYTLVPTTSTATSSSAAAIADQDVLKNGNPCVVSGCQDPAKNGPSTQSGDNTSTTSSGNSSTGVDPLTSWASNFWDKFLAVMQQLFVPAQSDLDSITTASQQLAGWGPFGIPQQIQADITLLQQNYTQAEEDGTYWRLYFGGGPWGLLQHGQFDSIPVNYVGNPLGYDPSVDQSSTAQTAPTIYDGMMPSYIDLGPFHDVLLISRLTLLIVSWFYFLVEMLYRFSPKPTF